MTFAGYGGEKPPKDMERKPKTQAKSHQIKRHPSQNTLQPIAHN